MCPCTTTSTRAVHPPYLPRLAFILCLRQELGNALLQMPNLQALVLSGVRITPLKNAYRAAMNAEYVPMPNKPTLNQFTQDHNTGTLIVRLKDHVFVLRDGVQYDMELNGARRRVFGYWLVQS